MAILLIFLLTLQAATAAAGQSSATVVQPGAPGKPTRTLPSGTRAKSTPLSPSDVAFMQGMIMHHAQAVEMTSLIPERSDSKAVRNLGKRISLSQEDEIRYMKQWLEVRGQATMMGMDMSDGHHEMPMMPGMLTAQQMDALRNAKGNEFDRLFLTGMIQHHRGALVMVKQLFDTAGAGQDAELFDFATDVDNTQRAEITLMEKIQKEHK